MISYFQAIVIGILQGVTELFPVSSLGHSILVPAWLGGDWLNLVEQASDSESPYLAFIVGLHVATASALLLLFWRDWVGIVTGLVSSVRHRAIRTTYERLAWLIVIATVPAGLIGLTFEHGLRTLFAKPAAAALFLTVNGLLLMGAEALRRRDTRREAASGGAVGGEAVQGEAVRGEVVRGEAVRVVTTSDATPTAGAGASGSGVAVLSVQAERVEADPGAGEPVVDPTDIAMTQKVAVRDAGVIGVIQSLALLPGISRSGITMSGGLLRGLTHREAVRFSFLLATPIIFAAGVLKIPDLVGPLGDGIRSQAVVGSAAAFVAAYLSARFLERWFRTRTLVPFAIYCLVAGGVSLLHFT